MTYRIHLCHASTFLGFGESPPGPQVPGTSQGFEGSTDDDNETTLTVADPTADRTITLPNVTGTVVTTGDSGTISSGMFESGVTLQILNSSGSALKTIFGAGA